MSTTSRYIVGIDLGTTHSVLAYLDTQNLLGQRLVYADGQATRGLALLRTTADAIDAHPQSRPSDRHRARLDLAVALYRAQQPQEALHEIDRLVAVFRAHQGTFRAAA